MTFAVIFLAVACALTVCASTALELMNLSSLRARPAEVPEEFKSFIDPETYRKGALYTGAHTRLSILDGFFGFLLMTALLVSGAFPAMYECFAGAFGGGFFAQALAVIAVMTVVSLPSLGFEYYEQFSIEQDFGFNKSTLPLWITDKLKGFAVCVVLCAPLLALILWFAQKFPSTWWVWGFAAVAVFQLVMIVVYPMFIVPLFNKLEDLKDGELKDALFALAKRGKFYAKTIQVIDGSRRSSHSNAYFTGFGRFRRIVLFDTLLEQLDKPELEAVLAHEIGHYRRGHIGKMILSSFVLTFAMFAFMGYFAQSDWFFTQFGFDKKYGLGGVVLIYALYAGTFTFWLNPIENYFSRRREYEADDFASLLCGGGGALISALKKLHTKNLGNLTPNPIYSAFHYSHPTLSERMKNLSNE